MSARLLGLAECSCHVWVVSTIDRIGHCGRCREMPAARAAVDGEALVTECKHEGTCRA